MIPMFMKLKVPRKDKKPLSLYIPLFLVWILLLVPFVLILPFWLIACLAFYLTGSCRTGFILIPLVINTFWHLRGLEVDVGSPRKSFCIKFL